MNPHTREFLIKRLESLGGVFVLCIIVIATLHFVAGVSSLVKVVKVSGVCIAAIILIAIVVTVLKKGANKSP